MMILRPQMDHPRSQDEQFLFMYTDRCPPPLAPPTTHTSTTMLLPYSARLRAANVRIVLASMSPRRQELMRMLFPDERPAAAAAAAAGSSVSGGGGGGGGPVPFTCVPSTFAEDLPHSAHATAASYACATSMAKAKEVWARVGGNTHVLIAADTVVVRDGVILEKPASHEHAFDMLHSLCGRTHQVVTGCTILVAADAAAASAPASDPHVLSFSVSTDVTFSASLSEESLRLYVASNEPMDKAGGYGYQSLAATFVTSINGCYFNVVGFPLHAIATNLAPHLERILQQIEKQKEEKEEAPAAAAAT